MMDLKWREWGTGLLAMLVALPAGCTKEDPQIAALRQQYLLTAEPAGATTIAEAKAAAAEKPDVLFVAQLDEDDQAASLPGQAAILVTEVLPKHAGHGDKNHAENCPFCKRRAAEAPRAAVQWVDASGDPLTVDARKLFGIGPGATVVVRGRGTVLPELGMFHVTATGIYVRSTGGSP